MKNLMITIKQLITKRMIENINLFLKIQPAPHAHEYMADITKQ